MLRSCIFAMVLAAVFITGCENNPKQTASVQPAISPEKRKADPVYAYVDEMRADLSNGKVQIINRVMRLSPEEAKVFWPIYHDYEEELFNLGDQRVELSRRFINDQMRQTLDNQRAAALADDWFKIESQQLELLQKYHKQIAKELSPIRAVQFSQIEHRVGTVVDLLIASELPLVRNNAAASR
jgi:hypothetical protein